MVPLRSHLFRHLHGDASGQGLVEYALIILLVAIAVVGAISVFGTELSAYYGRIAGAIP